MKRILIVGQRFSTFTDYLERHGFDYIVLKDIRHAKSGLKRVIWCDFSTKQSTIKSLEQLKQPVDGVMVTYENYILPTAWVAEHLGLPGLPAKSAEACTDKFLMRTLFANAPQKVSPDFATVNNLDDLHRFASSHTFPLILKPANLAKSLLVTKNHSLQELLDNYHQAMQQITAIYDKYAPARTPQLLIEEFLEGTVHSVDAFTGADGEPHVLEHVVDYQTGYDIGFDDNFHYSRILPSRLSLADQAALRQTAAIGIKALGIKNAPSHVEIIMTKDGPRIVEIGARNGGYRERMHRLANGLNIMDNAIKVSLGEKPQLVATKNDPCAVLELFPRHRGVFLGITNETVLRELPSLIYLSIKTEVGQVIGKSSEGHKMAAVIVLHNSDPAQFNKDLSYVDKHVSVMLNNQQSTKSNSQILAK